MPFGSQLSSQTPVFTERHFYASWNSNVGQGQSLFVNVTSMTMPFTGDLLVDLYVQCNYGPSILAAQVWPWTGIGATNFWAGKVTEYNENGGVLLCPFFARWSNLAVGTFFQLGIEVRNVVANGTVTISNTNGFIRAKAT